MSENNLHTNLKAYDNFETFNSLEEEEKYRFEKILDSEKHVNFIKKLINKPKINLLELGSGNSKLSINLNHKSLLGVAYNFEISQKRVDFANRWVKTNNYENIYNIKEDFNKLDQYGIKDIDLCFFVDLAFQFTEPITTNSELEVLKKINNTLNDSGKLVMELDGCKRIIDSIKISNKLWEEFKEPDPWIYSLWDCDFEKSKKFLTWKKTYISRDMSKIDKSEIQIKIYNKKEIKLLLESAGFKKVEFLGGWDGKPFVSDGSEYIVIASK